jgi:hypothetical protein
MELESQSYNLHSVHLSIKLKNKALMWLVPLNKTILYFILVHQATMLHFLSQTKRPANRESSTTISQTKRPADKESPTTNKSKRLLTVFKSKKTEESYVKVTKAIKKQGSYGTYKGTQTKHNYGSSSKKTVNTNNCTCILKAKYKTNNVIHKHRRNPKYVVAYFRTLRYYEYCSKLTRITHDFTSVTKNKNEVYIVNHKYKKNPKYKRCSYGFQTRQSKLIKLTIIINTHHYSCVLTINSQLYNSTIVGTIIFSHFNNLTDTLLMHS